MVSRPSTWILLGRTRVTATSRSRGADLEAYAGAEGEQLAEVFGDGEVLGAWRV